MDPFPGLGTALEQQSFAAALSGWKPLIKNDGLDLDYGSIGTFATEVLKLNVLRNKAATSPSATLPTVKGPKVAKAKAKVAKGEEGALVLASASDTDQQQSVKAILKHVFQPYRGYCSIARDSEALNLAPSNLARSFSYTASAFKNISNKTWGNLFYKIKKMLAASHDGIMFIAKFRFDETPSKIAIADLEASGIANFAVPNPGDSRSKSKPKPLMKQVAKILQTEFSIAALLRDRKSGQLMMISGNIPAPLQVLDRQTGANLAQALEATMALPGIEETANSFQQKLFLFATDEYAANEVAEFTMQARRSGWMRMSTLCDIHKGSTCQGRMFDLTGPAISAVINFSLTMTPAGSLGKLQALLSDIITSRFELRIGDPPYHAEACKYKEHILDLFCNLPDSDVFPMDKEVSVSSKSKHVHKQRQRLILQHFLNGDWRDHHKVVHYAKSGTYSTEDEALEYLLRYTVPALLPSNCPVFPRSRWFGADVTLDYIGLLVCVQGLFEPLVGQWCNRKESSMTEEADTFFALVAGSNDNAEDEVGWCFEEFDTCSSLALVPAVASDSKAKSGKKKKSEPNPKPETSCEGQAAAGSQSNELNLVDPNSTKAENEPEPEAGPAIEPPKDDQSFDWHTYHEKLKTSVADWVFSKLKGPTPQTMMVLMRQYMMPVLTLMAQLLHRSSAKWTKSQFDKACRGLEREYRMLLCWSRKDSKQVIEKVLDLMRLTPLALLECDMRADIGLLCFTMLSRLACSTFQLLHWRWGKYPYKLFSALQSEEDAKAVYEECRSYPCLLDELAHNLSSRHSESDFLSTGLQVIEAIALLAETDIGPIERQHTISRKIINSRSLAKSATFKTLNADWLLRQACQHKANTMSYLYFDSTRTRRKLAAFHRKQKKTIKAQKKKRGGGGAYRAFVSDFSKGFKLNKATMKELGKVYRTLKPEVLEFYKEVGQSASTAHKKGFKPFGPRGKSKKTKEQFHSDLGSLDVVSDSPGQSSAFQADSAAPGDSDSLLEALQAEGVDSQAQTPSDAPMSLAQPQFQIVLHRPDQSLLDSLGDIKKNSLQSAKDMEIAETQYAQTISSFLEGASALGPPDPVGQFSRLESAESEPAFEQISRWQSSMFVKPGKLPWAEWIPPVDVLTQATAH